jgi:hypothetical protein
MSDTLKTGSTSLAAPLELMVSRRKGLGRRLVRNRSAVIGLILVGIYVVVAIFAPVLAPYSAVEQHPQDRLQPPSDKYRLGTDEFGRDILSRLMYGATNSLRVAVLSVAIACLVGTTWGMIAGYAGVDRQRRHARTSAFPAILPPRHRHPLGPGRATRSWPSPSSPPSLRGLRAGRFWPPRRWSMLMRRGRLARGTAGFSGATYCPISLPRSWFR